MSEESVAIVKAMLAAGDGFDPDQKEAFLEALPGIIEQVFDPEIEWVEAPERIDATTRRGHDGVLESFRNWLDQWEEYNVEVGKIEDLGDEVFASGREVATGSGSGVSVDSDIYFIFTFRDGKIIRYQEFYDEQAARAAASA